MAQLKYEGAWTWSRLSDAERCKLLLRLRHVEKRDEGEESPALARVNLVHKRLDSWLKGRADKFPRPAGCFAPSLRS